MSDTVSFTSIIAKAKAICGYDFATYDEAQLGELVDMSCKEAYNSSDWWDRFLVFGEPRTVNRGIVERTEDSFWVYGAGTEEANGLYQRNGTLNSIPAYSLFDADGVTPKYSLWSGGASVDASISIGDPGSTSYLYDTAIIGSDYPTTGWDVVGGERPTPRLVDVSEIHTFMAIDMFDPRERSRCIKFGTTNRGAELLIGGTLPEIVWVTYKKKDTNIYGDGTGGTVSEIPQEWAEFVAYNIAYLHLASMRQTNPSPANGIALQKVNRVLEDWHMRIDREQSVQTIGNYVQTNYTNDRSLR